jgi:hypothetical protein
LEVDGEGFDDVGHGGSAAHVHGADGGLIHPGNDGGAAGSANTGGGVGVGVADAFFGELVKVWGDGVGVAVAAEVVINVLGGEPEDVGPVLGGDGEEEDLER